MHQIKKELTYPQNGESSTVTGCVGVGDGPVNLNTNFLLILILYPCKFSITIKTIIYIPFH